VKKLYDSQRRGIILGLPGSGKTTILKYFAYREFDCNRGGHPGEDGVRRIVLFIECRNIIRYEDWLQKGSRFNIETILNYLTYCFLFKREAVENISKDDKAELETAEKLVHQAFHNGRLTVLIDALDEEPSKDIKERILSIIRTLFTDSKKKKEDMNRFYLTSRYSEAEKYLWGKNAEAFQPMFEVRYLDMEQLRQMARYFYGEESPLYLEFDTAVWQEEIASKVGSTPLTALLVLAYFEIFRKFDTRYHMYNIIVIFILLRVWKQIKDKHFSIDMRTFFKEAKSKNILNEEKNAKEIYDALTLLSFAHMDIGKVIREEDIMGIFEMFAGGVNRGCPAE